MNSNLPQHRTGMGIPTAEGVYPMPKRRRNACVDVAALDAAAKIENDAREAALAEAARVATEANAKAALAEEAARVAAEARESQAARVAAAKQREADTAAANAARDAEEQAPSDGEAIAAALAAATKPTPAKKRANLKAPTTE